MLNYFILFFNLFVSFFFFTTPKFLKSRLLFHYQYLQYIFAGLFINLLLKIFIVVFTRIELTEHYNIALLLLCIILSSIINIYYYIIEIIGHLIRYSCEYIRTGDFNYVYIYADEATWNCPQSNKIIDRFYLSKPFFQFFILLRYFIIREPYLYLFFHIVIMINFLYDKHILYTYFYLLMLHLSRFIFFLGEEKFKIKEYMDHWQNMTLFLYSNLQVTQSFIVPHQILLKSLVYKLTVNNLNFAFFFNSRNYLDLLLYTTFRVSNLDYKAEQWRYNFHMQSNLEIYGSGKLEYILNLYTNLLNDLQKFIRVNTYFWFAIFLFTIYFDIYFTNLLLKLIL